MLNFDFYAPARIIFGRDTQHEIGKLLKPHAKKVLLHYGGGSIKKTGLYDQVVKSLKDSQIDFVELGGVVPNPRLSLVHEGIELCKKEGVDLILAVGGGSAIDSAKAIAMGVYYEGMSGRSMTRDWRLRRLCRWPSSSPSRRQAASPAGTP